MGSVLFFVVSAGAKNAQQQVLLTQEDRALSNDAVVKGIFSVGEPAFQTAQHSCSVPFLDQAYVNVNMLYLDPPRSCTLFVNDKYVKTDRDLKPDCIRECPAGEFARTYSLGFLDVRDSHEVRVCCNDICIEKALPKVCERSAPGSDSSD